MPTYDAIRAVDYKTVCTGRCVGPVQRDGCTRCVDDCAIGSHSRKRRIHREGWACDVEGDDGIFVACILIRLLEKEKEKERKGKGKEKEKKVNANEDSGYVQPITQCVLSVPSGRK